MKQEKIVLGDGKEYTISEFNIGDFIKIEEKYGNLKLDENKLEPIIFWFWLALKKVHKDLSLEQQYSLIPASFVSNGKIGEIFDRLAKLNGWDTAGKNSQRPMEEEQAAEKKQA